MNSWARSWRRKARHSRIEGVVDLFFAFAFMGVAVWCFVEGGPYTWLAWLEVVFAVLFAFTAGFTLRTARIQERIAAAILKLEGQR